MDTVRKGHQHPVVIVIVAGSAHGSSQAPKSVAFIERDGSSHLRDRLGVTTSILKLPCGLQALGQQCVADSKSPTSLPQIHPLELTDRVVAVCETCDAGAT